MGLFTVNVRHKGHLVGAPPLWSNDIDAADVEEAYRIGKAQFDAEYLDLASEPVSIEAALGYVEK